MRSVVDAESEERTPLLPPKLTFDELFRLSYDMHVRRAFLLVGSEEAAHDIVAEAFTKIHPRWAEIDDPRLYLSRSVSNGCRDWGRKRSRWSRLVKPKSPSDELTVDASAEADFNKVELAQALAKLPYRQRAAIVLRYYSKESNSDIAEILDCEPGTVGSLLHRGLARLRKELS